MASSTKVVVDPEHLEGGDGTLRMALSMWSTRNDPITYNQFQALYFELCRGKDYPDDEAPPGESQADRQLRMKSLFDDVQSQAHGPGYLELAMASASKKAKEIAEAANLLRQEASVIAVANEAARLEAAAAQEKRAVWLDTGAAGPERDTSRTAAGVLSGFQATSYTVPRVIELLRQHDTTPAGRAALLGEQLDSMRDALAERFPIGTPGTSPSSIAGDSPDRMLHQQEAQEIWDNDGCTHTEMSDDADERLLRLAAKLAEMEGAEPPQVRFVVRVDQLMREYREQYSLWKNDIDYPERCEFSMTTGPWIV